MFGFKIVRENAVKDLQEHKAELYKSICRLTAMYGWARTIATGCPKHRSYRGVREPNPECPICVEVYECVKKLQSEDVNSLRPPRVTKTKDSDTYDPTSSIAIDP